MTYQDKLKDPRWQKKRLEILERDNWTCQCCGSKTKTLNVHHINYKADPWEVENCDVQTLCEDCHEALGPHPKGGVYWDFKNCFMVCRCPKCGEKISTRDDAPRFCKRCHHEPAPLSFPFKKKQSIGRIKFETGYIGGHFK
jgi:hypothetical protein